MLAQSMYVGGNDETIEDPDKDQLSNEHRGDWENIWGNM